MKQNSQTINAGNALYYPPERSSMLSGTPRCQMCFPHFSSLSSGLSIFMARWETMLNGPIRSVMASHNSPSPPQHSAVKTSYLSWASWILKIYLLEPIVQRRLFHSWKRVPPLRCIVPGHTSHGNQVAIWSLVLCAPCDACLLYWTLYVSLGLCAQLPHVL